MADFGKPFYQPGGEADSSPDLMTETLNPQPQVEVDPKRCHAKAKGTGTQCQKSAGWGTDHLGSGLCKFHGGKSPGGRKQAQKAVAVKARDTYGLPRDVDPHTALLEEVHRTAGHVAWLGAIVAQLRKGDLSWGVTKVKRGGDDWGETQEAKLNVYLAMYNDERKHLVKVTDVAIKAGVEQKRLDLEQHRAELVVTMLGTIFDDLELTPEQMAKLDELVPRALTGLAALEAAK